MAQLVDGALGMAYGLTANTILLALGVPPAAASATIHAAEVATTGVSGLSHAIAGNVDWRLVRRLAIAGSVGGVAGATVLSRAPVELIAAAVSLYLACMGLVIVRRALMAARRPGSLDHAGGVALAGGFCDAVGGGGWGPIVSGTLMLSGHEPRRMIGSSNAAEFAVTVAITAAFLAHMSIGEFGMYAVALVAGGLPAAPLAAWLVRIAPRRVLMIAVGVLISALGVVGVVRVLAT